MLQKPTVLNSHLCSSVSPSVVGAIRSDKPSSCYTSSAMVAKAAAATPAASSASAPECLKK